MARLLPKGKQMTASNDNVNPNTFGYQSRYTEYRYDKTLLSIELLKEAIKRQREYEHVRIYRY